MAIGFIINGVNWDAVAFSNSEKVVSQLKKIYERAAREIAKLTAAARLNPNKPFQLSEYPKLKKQVDKLLRDMATHMKAMITNGTLQSWAIANAKNDALIDFMSQRTGIDKQVLRQRYDYGARNEDALKAFQQRREGGLGLSQRVWKSVKSANEEITAAIDTALTEGTPAAKLSQLFRQALIEPNKQFKKGSKNWRKYHPGQGVYRSSYKNAMRVARTEVNTAYREADYQRWSQMDFVKGIEIKLSNNPHHCEVCEGLAGKYPKDFRFLGWHPQCRCYAVPILLDMGEYDEYERASLRGGDYTPKGVVTEVPNNFRKFIASNKKRIMNGASIPYILTHNTKFDKKLQTAFIERTLSDAKKVNLVTGVIAKNNGGFLTMLSKKSEKRIFEKAKQDYNGDIFQVKDIVRNTIILPNGDFKNVISQLKRRITVVKVKEQIVDEDPLGYSGFLIHIQNKSGTYFETQINTPQMIYAKEPNAIDLLGDEIYNKIKSASGLPPGLGHKYYEEYRIMDPINDAKKMSILQNKSKKYYKKIRAVQL